MCLLAGINRTCDLLFHLLLSGTLVPGCNGNSRGVAIPRRAQAEREAHHAAVASAAEMDPLAHPQAVLPHLLRPVPRGLSRLPGEFSPGAVSTVWMSAGVARMAAPRGDDWSRHPVFRARSPGISALWRGDPASGGPRPVRHPRPRV